MNQMIFQTESEKEKKDYCKDIGRLLNLKRSIYVRYTVCNRCVFFIGSFQSKTHRNQNLNTLHQL